MKGCPRALLLAAPPAARAGWRVPAMAAAGRCGGCDGALGWRVLCARVSQLHSLTPTGGGGGGIGIGYPGILSTQGSVRTLVTVTHSLTPARGGGGGCWHGDWLSRDILHTGLRTVLFGRGQLDSTCWIILDHAGQWVGYTSQMTHRLVLLCVDAHCFIFWDLPGDVLAVPESALCV